MKDLSIKEFVKETLLEIADGIREAQKEMWDKIHNQPIAPAIMGKGKEIKNVIKESNISFDIAVTATSSENSKKEGGIKIKVVDANLGKENKISKEFINRVRFDIPFYPQALSFKDDENKD